MRNKNSGITMIATIIMIMAGFIATLGGFVSTVHAAGISVTSIGIGAQSGTVTYGSDGSATFAITLTTSGTGNGSSTLSVSGLPSGVTGSFNPATVDLKTSTTSQLTISTNNTAKKTNAGPITFTVTATNAVNSNTGTFTIAKRQLTVTAAASSKVYDGTTAAAATPSVTSGTLANGDTASFTESFGTKSVGTGKALVPAGSVSDGNSGNNYAYVFVNNNSGVVTAKPLTVSGITAADKEYDGSASATLRTAGAALVGVAGSDNVNLDASAATGTFASAVPGTWQVAIAGLSLSGTDAGNYSLQPATATAKITDAVAVFNQPSPAPGSYINSAAAGYNLSKMIVGGAGTITFTRTGGADDPSSPHVYNLSQTDLTAGAHSIDTGFALVNGAVYTVTMAAADGAGTAAQTVTNDNILYDAAAAAATITVPASSSYINSTAVSYTLSKDVQSGKIVFTRTAGAEDAASHSYTLSGAELTAGPHAVATALNLVDGAVYSVTLANVVDLEGNQTQDVSNTGITYDVSAVSVTNVGPAGNSFIVNSNVVYTLSEQAQAGTVTFTQTGGTGDPASPHVYSMSAADLTAGDHSGAETVVTGITLVIGATYTVTFDVTDKAGNHTTVSNASAKMVQESVTLTPDKTSPAVLAAVGSVTFTAQASGGSDVHDYEFYVNDPSVGPAWILAQPYGAANTFTWTPAHAGTYKIAVYTKGAGSPMLYEAASSVSFYVLDNPPVSSVALSSDKVSPQVVASAGTVTFNATAAGGILPKYKFVLSGPVSATQEYSDASSFAWTPPQSGLYSVTAYAKSEGSTMQFEAAKTMGFTMLANAPVTAVTLAADKATTLTLSTAGTVTVTATATGGNGTPEYKFAMTGAAAATQDYSASSTFSFAPAQTGTYTVTVYTRNAGSPLGYEAAKSMTFTVLTNTPVSAVTLAADMASPQLLSAAPTVNFTATATGGASPQYKFCLKGPSTGDQTVTVQDYSSSNRLSWTPAQAGIYTVTVYARSAGSFLASEATKAVSFTILVNPAVTSVTLSASKASPQLLSAAGTITFTAAAAGGVSPQYQFLVKGPTTGNVNTVMQAYSATSTFQWTPAVAGSYTITVNARSDQSPSTSEAAKGMTFAIQ